MKTKQNSAAVVLLVLLAAALYGVFLTGREGAVSRGPTTRFSPADSAVEVDQSSLTTAQQLVRLPTTADERPLAEDALRLGDQEMDLAFADAVREAATHPRAMTSEARAVDARLEQAEKQLAADQAQVAQLTAAVNKANGANANALDDRLDVAKAQVALDQDEVDDARADLMRAGGDPEGRMEAMIQEHDAASRRSDSTRVSVTPPVDAPGLIHHVQSLQALHQKELQLRQARAAAESAAVVFGRRHDVMEARASTHRAEAPSGALSHDSSASLLAIMRRRAGDEKAKVALDQRVDNQRRLADVYARWIHVVDAQQRAVANRALRGIALILFIVLIGLFFEQWIEHVLGIMAMDRRQTQTLHMVSRVSLQVLGVLLILLVIFGPPNNLGMFLGLAGAGLTVAGKDFIIGFFGGFVLMGKNGIRIGDLVEINGVTGEVVELGVFQTTLSETGGWSDAGHPTGRRVTFGNSFAIEGHYFNFSTSGQWLWDEVRIVVPAGQDPYPIADAVQKQVEEATADNAREAERQWKGAERSPKLSALTAAPAVNIKPIIGGVEITVRYITQMGERSQLRAKLYHTAVDLLGGKHAAPPSPLASAPRPAP
jgi:small-conductance mechanosensitive channel